ncbi:hypothetical protein GUJ93_ZPchr0010g10580 [Zizania palustris]|uniref:Pectinesterase inhibitor domain-containing protein n=1 Tax=Zizania palustris TaxID=103762 RepID=A0A8J5WDY7_ZIZPA|nr:hypothetical protein GUJ93_ZPchr0010g10580 [Zizania palustris]
MAKAAAFVVLSMSLTATFVFSGCDACEDAASMSAVDACKQAGTGVALAELCAATLGTSPAPKEETAFVLAAANAAGRSYVATLQAIVKLMLGKPKVSDETRKACDACTGSYMDARDAMNDALGHLASCSLAELIIDFPRAVSAVDDCATKVLRAEGLSPLYSMIIGDRDLSMLGLRLTVMLLHPPPN